MKKPTLPDTGRFEQVATEYGDQSMCGSDYGNPVRVILRSPTAVLFTGYGVNLWRRSAGDSNRAIRHLCYDKPTNAWFESDDVRKCLVDVFGDGADLAAMVAWRSRARTYMASGPSDNPEPTRKIVGMGTVLVDGGGDPLKEPRRVRRENVQARHAAVTPTRAIDLTGDIATCRQCGENLKPHTVKHHMGGKITADHPKSVEDCQKLTNQRVISVHGYDTRYPDRWEYVDWFQTWDGESLVDPYFCNSGCAAVYGRRAVVELASLPVGGSPPPRPQNSHESIQHHEEAERWMTGPNGNRYRI